MKTRKLSMAFSEPQLEFLRTEAARLGISVSELLRRIIDAYRDKR